jgi:hypothetical protein
MCYGCQATADARRSSPLRCSHVECRHRASAVDGSHVSATPFVAYYYIIDQVARSIDTMIGACTIHPDGHPPSGIEGRTLRDSGARASLGCGKNSFDRSGVPDMRIGKWCTTRRCDLEGGIQRNRHSSPYPNPKKGRRTAGRVSRSTALRFEEGIRQTSRRRRHR